VYYQKYACPTNCTDTHKKMTFPTIMFEIIGLHNCMSICYTMLQVSRTLTHTVGHVF